MKWYKKSLEHIVKEIYNGNGSEELIKDWLVAYEAETGDRSLRDVKDCNCFLSSLSFLLPDHLSFKECASSYSKSIYSRYKCSLSRKNNYRYSISFSHSMCVSGTFFKSHSKSSRGASYISLSNSDKKSLNYSPSNYY